MGPFCRANPGRYAAPCLIACLGLAACSSRTDLSATGNVPAQYEHVFVTITEVGFNTSATAGPTDSSWDTFTLSTPQTIDLATLTNGTLAQIASELKVSSGTYAQVQLILADTAASLTASAQAVGALTNNEVDYLDADGDVEQAPLQVVNVAEGISISTSLTVGTSLGSGLDEIATSSAATSSTASSAATSSAATVSTTSGIVDFDASRDVIPVSVSGQLDFVLNPHPTFYDASAAGTIGGEVDLSSVLTLTDANGTAATDVPDVQVDAETLSADGTRHVVVETTLVSADGTFNLYPLSTASGAPTAYDLVIHGPTIDTTIIKSVPVSAGAPGTATALLGTITPTSATPFMVNVDSSNPISPSTASVGFYQTLPLSGEVPYLVEMRGTDPLSGVFATDQYLSGGSLLYTTYVSGGTLAFTSATPSEGAATYHVAAISSLYGTGALSTTVKSPGNTTTVASFTAAVLPLPSGATADSFSGTLSVTNPGEYNKGELFLTYGGVLAAAIPLDSYLAQSQSTVTLGSAIPGGGITAAYAPGVYYGEIWTWNSNNPAATLVRAPLTTTIDLSAGDATGVALSVQ